MTTLTSNATHTPNGEEPGSDPGVVGNARLTAATGLILLVLFAAEIVTDLLGVANVLTAHVVIGLMLTPPVLVKMGSTGWRIVRYYRGDRAYAERGAPRLFLRILGPLLILLTAVLIGSGFLAYLAHGGLYDAALKTHKVVFYIWLLAVIAHVVPHFVEAVSWAFADLSTRARGSVPGAGTRRTILIVALLVGGVAGVILSGHVGGYFHTHPIRLHL
ncbi:hypothetical protein ABH935_007700 [Catenulispora sp. GAS73]|uniref:hypothetical protein n=1 Tax=Catenulispora sp. GAS73 TaxID=3156269 RepID=UPI0035183356